MSAVKNMDSIRFLGGMDPDSVDCVLTDPPYSNGGLFRNQRNRSTSKKIQSTGTVDLKPDFFGDCRDQRSLEKWCSYWMGECWRVLRPGGMLMCFIDWRNLAAVIDAIQVAGFTYRGVFCWNKANARPQKGIFRNDTEFVVYGTKGDVIQQERYAKGYLECTPVPTKKRIHSTEKPVELLERLLCFVPDGGMVVDPFAGSGAVGEACHNLGIRFSGSELSEEYAALANSRLEGLS